MGHITRNLFVFLGIVLSQATATTASASVDHSKENQEQGDGVGGTDEAGLSSKAAPATSAGVASENGGSMRLVRVSVSQGFFFFSLRLVIRLLRTQYPGNYNLF